MNIAEYSAHLVDSEEVRGDQVEAACVDVPTRLVRDPPGLVPRRGVGGAPVADGDLAAALVPELLAHRDQLVLDHLHQPLGAGQYLK